MSHLRWTEYDPYTGVTEINDAYDDDDLVHVRYQQELGPTLDSLAEARNLRTADNPKKDLHLYCKVPVLVQHELLLKGINIFNPDHMPRVLAEINANYPNLKATDKTHALGSRRPASSQKVETSTEPGPSVIVP
jgi:hypothetical protein